MPIVCADAHVAAFVEEAIERRHSRGARGEENYKNVLDGSDELVDRRHNDGRRSVAGGCTAFGKITEAASHEGTRIQSRFTKLENQPALLLLFATIFFRLRRGKLAKTKRGMRLTP